MKLKILLIPIWKVTKFQGNGLLCLEAPSQILSQDIQKAWVGV